MHETTPPLLYPGFSFPFVLTNSKMYQVTFKKFSNLFHISKLQKKCVLQVNSSHKWIPPHSFRMPPFSSKGPFSFATRYEPRFRLAVSFSSSSFPLSVSGLIVSLLFSLHRQAVGCFWQRPPPVPTY